MGIRVFVLEDELIHAEAMKLALEEAGLELAGECADADQAFDMIAAAGPDVLLADIALPGLNNGITVADRVRRELGIPHIFTTSFSDEEIIRQAVETRPAGYLRKPVDPVNLRAAVEIALRSCGESRSPLHEKQNSLSRFHLPESSSVEKSGEPTSGESFRDAEPMMEVGGEIPVFTRIGDKLVRINTDDLLIVRADGGNYISLVFEKREISCRSTLRDISRQLPPTFIQVHRSCYINLKHLDFFNEREQTASLKGHLAPVGRRFRQTLIGSIRQI